MAGFPSTEQSSSDDDFPLLLRATGRASVHDALHWIAEGRDVSGDINASALLSTLVAAADSGLVGADSALRVAVRNALHSTLDTSAELVLTDTITPPWKYQTALASVAKHTVTGTLADVSASAVLAAQRNDSKVILALSLVAGMSWRDLHDRAHARGVRLPGEPDGSWSSTQVRAAFDVIDEIVRDVASPQIPGATAARPLELLLGGLTGWEAVETLRIAGVDYGTLLAQRDVGSAWSAHRNRTNTELSRLMAQRVLDALDEASVNYWSTEGTDAVTSSALGERAGAGARPPGQLTAVTKRENGRPGYAVLVATARDGGTARKTAATLLKIPSRLKAPAALVLFGTGWAGRGESDALVRAYEGRIFTEYTLGHLAALATVVGAE